MLASFFWRNLWKLSREWNVFVFKSSRFRAKNGTIHIVPLSTIAYILKSHDLISLSAVNVKKSVKYWIEWREWEEEDEKRKPLKEIQKANSIGTILREFSSSPESEVNEHSRD